MLFFPAHTADLLLAPLERSRRVSLRQRPLPQTSARSLGCTSNKHRGQAPRFFLRDQHGKDMHNYQGRAR